MHSQLHLPRLAGLPFEISAALQRKATPLTLTQGSAVSGASSLFQSVLLLLSGSVQVLLVSENGPERPLYRVAADTGRAPAAAGLLAVDTAAVEVVAETDVEALLIPRCDVDSLMSASAELRALVFAAYSKRVTDLLAAIERLACERVPIRLC
ncbi:Crp/Fnr family transcriptional regulator [Roseobacter sinensis]|uniref:Cyclic nucleotide-binding domain-containing protein n=1 Tax=Roseobacter sinensis TaxID=2931391 RepID=A0ABT3BD83_9RHOB|nr:hypothetical protein [Roseobacter sp. WL0113]MCV3271505.1 hypothetical protein [Roseobacter sp. WL0113]